ncbi:MAG: DUF4445 domain-containing protein [Anaerolineales bacterium]|nr:DUF4445 domain-containing protein [Anaerolineales bacterium]
MARQVRGTKGQTLLDAMRAVFPNAEAPCGGSGRCGRCRVRVRADAAAGRLPEGLLSPPDEEEKRLLGTEEIQAGGRLSCRARFQHDGSLLVERQEREFFLPNIIRMKAASAAEGGETCAAVDLGTTTVACALADVAGGGILARAAEANRQRSYGQDVVSRIENGLRAPDQAAGMRRLIHEQAQAMLDGLCRRSGTNRPPRIHICGNTTMLHLWEGADLAGLSRMPFEPAFLESRETALDLEGADGAECRLLPMISAFVGADISAGILACGLADARGRPELLVDIGTNGEIVLSAEGKLWATATAAGPAFEGAEISCGMPAMDGAVDTVDQCGGVFSFTVLGRLPPAGICGSGLLDLLAGLRRAGLLDENGALKVEADSAGEKAFTLSEDPPLRITQADIRRLQLAKGAIAAGIQTLCRSAGVRLEEVGMVHLAGGFGSSLSPESARIVGLIPQELGGRIEPAGNTALAGTLMTARDPALLEGLIALAPAVRVLDLSRAPGFQEEFVNAMRFPHSAG